MDNKDDYVELVKQAQLGDKDVLNQLAELARERLRVYVHRLTLADDVTQDILQETMLEMFKFIDKLKRADRFWPWLFRIAANKVNHHYKKEQRRRTVSLSEIEYKGQHKDSHEEVADMVSQELKQGVLAAMGRLKPQQRNILALRCYEGLKYSQIAEAIGCSEIGAQMRFFRAKKALAKQLSRHGLGKGTLLTALVVFGKMTAPSKVAAAQISITAATTKVGIAAGLAAVAASKTIIVSVATVGVLAVGTMVETPKTNKAPVTTPAESLPKTSYVTTQPVQADKPHAECWYYYPPNGNGAVMMRFKSDGDGRQSYCQWLQNDQANYYRHGSTMYINNHRMWESDLAVKRLPTDSPQLTKFLSRVDGTTEPLQYVRHNGRGLLIIAKQDENADFSQITHRYDASNEEYFRYNWPKGVKTVDNRDAIHKRGWTHFKVSGRVNGKQVHGQGCMPFVYSTSRIHRPWLRLKIGDRKIVDRGHGSLFKGLGRPWMGLHTIDTVRRDAAEKQIWFETKLRRQEAQGTGQKAEVVLTHNDIKLVYIIDMDKDVVDSITFLEDQQVIGELGFSYMEEGDEKTQAFAEPKPNRYGGLKQGTGILWLFELVNGE